MTLTLSIRGAGALDNGAPAELVLHRRGGVVGRAPTCDWSLPDPRNHISSRHLEVRFDGGGYLVTDLSTNGTFLNGATARMAEPRRVKDGDRFQVGHYEIRAALTGDAAAGVAAPASAPPAWTGWEGAAGTPAPEPLPPAPASGGWDAAPSPPPSARWAPEVGPSLARPEAHRPGGFAAPPASPVSGGWSPAAAAPAPPVASAWAAAQPPAEPASGWSSAAPDRPAQPSADDVWGRIAEGNVVDWARGGFGQPVERQRDPLGLDPAPARDALPPRAPEAVRGIADGWGAAPAAPPAPAPAPPPPPPAPAGGEAVLAGAGLRPEQVPPSPALPERAGQLLRRLVAGLVVMVEARARAKAQLGAEPTAFSPEGHNPLKYARAPDEAVAMLLGPPQAGFMPAERAIEDAFQELQTHQMATLRAMQGALRATLERFSPDAIAKRAETRGLLERIVPAARDAALWQAYVKEFGGVAKGSDEAFMDVFAAEFRRAYNEGSRKGPR